MEKLLVIRTGQDYFDALHAYGVAITVAELIGEIVELRDCGLSYVITLPAQVKEHQTHKTFQDILALPKDTNLDRVDQVEIANLDGLLASTFTSPGPRLVSVMDFGARSTIDREAATGALSKVRRLVARLENSIEKCKGTPRQWMADIVSTYAHDDFKTLWPEYKGSHDVGINMPLEPAFGYGTRRARSDGLVADKTNVTIAGAKHVVVHTYVGAARVLRAQSVGSHQVIMYVPMPHVVNVSPGFHLPILRSTDLPWRQAAYCHWLTLWSQSPGTFEGLGYQVLQQQGAKQAFSKYRGILPYSYLSRLSKQCSTSVMARWRRDVTTPVKSSDTDPESVIDYLSFPGPATLRRHLHNVAQIVNSSHEMDHFAYELHEVIAMNECQDEQDELISSVLQRDRGTLRFGRSLRILGEHNRSDLRDSIDELEKVETRDHLIRALAQAMQRCILAKTRSDFIIVPTDEDAGQLLHDVHQFGARDIAGILILLSSLRYPQQPAVPQAVPLSLPDSLSPDYSI